MKQIIELLETIEQAYIHLRHQLEQDNMDTSSFLVNDLLAGVQAVIPLFHERATLPVLPEADFTDKSSLSTWLDVLENWIWHAYWAAENLRIEDPLSFKPQCTLDLQFFLWLNEVSTLSKEKIFSHIKQRFLAQSARNQYNLEDYFKQFTFWGSLNVEAEDFTIWENKAESFHEHWRDYLWLYQRVEDYRSRLVLFGIVNNWYQQDFQTLHNAIDQVWPDYFDPDVISCDENEVLVDLGAYTGDTVTSYIQFFRHYKKIYCYEITPMTFQTLQNTVQKYPNIECRMKGAGKEKSQMFISVNSSSTSANILTAQGNIPIEVVAIDEDITEPVTFIKMDIEGAEQDALLGCARHIQQEHPKLAISVYHNNEDLWKIPRMIDQICPGYRFWLRYHGGDLYPTETSLLAVYQP